jgi:hypothetical protein
MVILMVIEVDWQSLDADGNWLDLDRKEKLRTQARGHPCQAPDRADCRGAQQAAAERFS